MVNIFSENLVNIYDIIENNLKNENNKEKKLRFINDCLDWVDTLQDILLKMKKEIDQKINIKEEEKS